MATLKKIMLISLILIFAGSYAYAGCGGSADCQMSKTAECGMGTGNTGGCQHGDGDCSGQCKGENKGLKDGTGHGPDFIDADGDGICDNASKGEDE